MTFFIDKTNILGARVLIQVYKNDPSIKAVTDMTDVPDSEISYDPKFQVLVKI